MPSSVPLAVAVTGGILGGAAGGRLTRADRRLECRRSCPGTAGVIDDREHPSGGRRHRGRRARGAGRRARAARPREVGPPPRQGRGRRSSAASRRSRSAACTSSARRSRKGRGSRDSPELALRDWLSYAQFGEGDAWPRRWARLYCDRSLDLHPRLSRRRRGEVPARRELARARRLRARQHRSRGGTSRGARATPSSSRSSRALANASARGPPRDSLPARRRGPRGRERARDRASSAPTSRPAGGSSRAATRVVIATGGICGGDLSRVRGELVRALGRRLRRCCSTERTPFGDGTMHDAVARAGGNLTHLDRQWHYAAGIHHPAKRRPDDGLSLVPPRSALWLNAKGERIGPVPLVGSTDTRFLVESILRQPGQYSWQLMNNAIAKKELAVSGCDYMTAFRHKRKLLMARQLLFGNQELVDRLTRECPEDIVTARSLEELVDRMNERNLDGLRTDLATVRDVVRDYDAQIDRGPALLHRRPAPAHRELPPVPRRPAPRLQLPEDPRPGREAPHRDPRVHPLAQEPRRHPDRPRRAASSTPRARRSTGLYAVGEAAGFGGGGIHGMGSLEGTFLGSCVLTGRVAARTIAGRLRMTNHREDRREEIRGLARAPRARAASGHAHVRDPRRPQHRDLRRAQPVREDPARARHARGGGRLRGGRDQPHERRATIGTLLIVPGRRADARDERHRRGLPRRHPDARDLRRHAHGRPVPVPAARDRPARAPEGPHEGLVASEDARRDRAGDLRGLPRRRVGRARPGLRRDPGEPAALPGAGRGASRSFEAPPAPENPSGQPRRRGGRSPRGGRVARHLRGMGRRRRVGGRRAHRRAARRARLDDAAGPLGVPGHASPAHGHGLLAGRRAGRRERVPGLRRPPRDRDALRRDSDGQLRLRRAREPRARRHRPRGPERELSREGRHRGRRARRRAAAPRPPRRAAASTTRNGAGAQGDADRRGQEGLSRRVARAQHRPGQPGPLLRRAAGAPRRRTPSPSSTTATTRSSRPSSSRSPSRGTS